MNGKGIGIIGTGWGVRAQLPGFRAAGLEVVALAGSRAEKTRTIAAELGVPFATGDWRELIARDDVVLVSITTPPILHREMALAALAAGKHVLCEKPTAMDAAEAREMLAAAEARPGQLALIDHELRFLPALREARRLVAEGVIGQVRHAECRVLSGSRANPQRPWSWWSDAGQGGGALGAMGSHQVDYLRYILADEPVAARGVLRTLVNERPDENGRPTPVTADDFATFELRFGGGALASVLLNMVAPLDEPNSLTFYGDAGVLRFVGGRLFHRPIGASERELTPPHSVNFPPGISGLYPEGTLYFGQALHAALSEGDSAALAIAATFRDGLQVQEALDAVRRSDEQGWSMV